MRAEAWPEADVLFRSDPLWMGSDDAYSVPLGPQHTLWLFGDTFVAGCAGSSRGDCSFLRNTIGIQRGSDPSTASMSFHWRMGSDGPADFFRSEGAEGARDAEDDGWLWPLDGKLIDGVLLLFFMRVRPTSKSGGTPIEQWREMGSLGFFDVHGSAAMRVTNPKDHPDLWRIEALDVPDRSRITGTALLLDGDHLLSYSRSDTNALLCRWDARKAALDSLDACEWWQQDQWGWEQDRATVVLDKCASEFTVHRQGTQLLHVQMEAIGPGGLQVRSAPTPQGPFGPPTDAYLPEEAGLDGVMAYAAKAHPQLSGADLVCTYASVAEADQTIGNPTIYFPRFVRLWDVEEAH